MSKEGDHNMTMDDGVSSTLQHSGNFVKSEEDSVDKLPKTRQAGKDVEATPPPPTMGDKRTTDKGSDQEDEEKAGGCGDILDHDTHPRTKREQRKKISDMFANLHALLPQLPPKANRTTIVEETINYIGTLEETLQKLEKRKQEKLDHIANSREAILADEVSSNDNSTPFQVQQNPPTFQTWTYPNVNLNVCGQDAHINICCPKKAGILSAICYILEKHKLDVVTYLVSSNDERRMYMIHANANEVCKQIKDEFPVQEIFKQAAREIVLVVNS